MMTRSRKSIGVRPINRADDAEPFFPDGKTNEQRANERRDYRHQFVSEMLIGVPTVTKERLMAKSMWDDHDSVGRARALRGKLYDTIYKYLERGGNIRDVSEILLSLIPTEIAKDLAKDKYGMVDPNDPLS